MPGGPDADTTHGPDANAIRVCDAKSAAHRLCRTIDRGIRITSVTNMCVSQKNNGRAGMRKSAL